VRHFVVQPLFLSFTKKLLIFCFIRGIMMSVCANEFTTAVEKFPSCANEKRIKEQRKTPLPLFRKEGGPAGPGVLPD